MMQRSPSNPDIFGEIFKSLKDLRALIESRTNQQITTFPTYDPLHLPVNAQNGEGFIGTDNKFYVIIGGLPILIGP